LGQFPQNWPEMCLAIQNVGASLTLYEPRPWCTDRRVSRLF